MAGPRDIKWSKSEKTIARKAFDRAVDKEHAMLASRIRTMAEELDDRDNIWALHDFLSKKRREIDEKYDYRYSVLLFVFARLIREGWIAAADLQGLSEEKIEIILHLAKW